MARVVSIFKKGNPRLPENYRPISLLNTLYKVYAGILKRRLESGIDHKLSQLQFGFRTGKSTTQAIYIIRRLQDMAEQDHHHFHFLFLDWEKAFDRVHIPALLLSLDRLGVPPPLAQAIRSIYQHPTFFVEMDMSVPRCHK